MLIIEKKRFGWWTRRHGMGVGMALACLVGIISAVVAVHAQAAVIEFFNPDLNNYFITADPVEQDFVDTGAVGQWQRTGYAFATGGPNQVCRFGGNGSINPATGTFYGPNSHFYTADPAECAGLKAIFTASGKSWKFESNDFLTTPAVNGGCAAGLVPVYRAYNNGFARGIDSNHRITSSHAAYLQTVAAGSIGEGVVMCAPAGLPPVATAVGVPTGSGVIGTVGAAGGSVSAPGGKLVLTIPAGALAADTAISIEPFTNTAPGGSGAAYRLTPEGQTFLKPISLRFTYTDQDLLGTAANFLGAAFQTADRYWQWIDDPIVDTGAKTVSVALSHFTVIAQVAKYQIDPGSKTVKMNGTVGLTVRGCFDADPNYVNLLGGSPLGSGCLLAENLIQTHPNLSVNEWSVNGRLGGGGVFGTVVGSGATATYTAPSTVPIPNPVTVSARVHDPKHPENKDLVSSIITIADDSWTGTASGADQFWTVTVDVTWTLDSFVDNVASFSPTGTASMSNVVAPGCTARFTPSTHSLDPTTDGNLTIDYNSTPPTYHGYGLSIWAATLTAISGDCEGTTPTGVAGGAFFGGSSGVLDEATGVVSPDGVTIEGSGSDTSSPPINFRWKFTRNQ